MIKLNLTNRCLAVLLIVLLFGCSKPNPELPKEEEKVEQKEEEKNKPSEEQTENGKKKEDSKEDKDKTTAEEEKKKEATEEEKKEKEQKEKVEEESTENYAEPATLSPVFYVKFTGQLCLYCPKSTRLTIANQKKYGKNNYIYVALHSEERFSLLKGKQVSLYNKEAQEYRRNITNRTGLPDSYYNRLGKTFSPLDDLSLSEMYKEPDLLDCQGKAQLNAEGKVELSLKTLLRRDRQEYIKDKNVYMLLWILENDIVAYQQDAEDKRYHTWPKHQHIFRSSLNGHWGEPYKIGLDYKKVFDFPENVSKSKNCEIIVLFLNHSDKLVLDAACFKVK